MTTLRATKEPCSVDETTLKRLTSLRDKINELLTAVHPHTSPPEITLGRPDGIARFFAFCFINRKKLPLASLSDFRMPGSGVYAIYYHGTAHETYQSISRTETPIYVGKADPEEPFADTPETQGFALHARLKEHARSIARASNLKLADFEFRSANVQSGMQPAVEAFMIRLFKPIWNREVKICYGIGKHGDSADTRRNKRSPWDTMHPGRAWAAASAEDQRKIHEIEAAILHHFTTHQVFTTKESLLQKLAL